MRAAALLFLLFVLALVCVAARGQDDDAIPVRVQCDGVRVAVLQFVVRESGVYTLRIPVGVCGRAA